MDVKEISCEDLKKMIKKEKDFFLIDVREPEEYELGHIFPSVLIPLAELGEHLDDFDKGMEYVVHCKMGGRSSEAALIMMEQGFKKVKSLVGGYQRWCMLDD